MKRLLLNFVLLSCAASLLAQSYETVYTAHLRNGFSIRHYRSEVAGSNTRLYLTPEATSGYAEIPTAEITTIDSEQISITSHRIREEHPNAPKPVAELIANASRSTGIDADFLGSVIHAESNFNPKARSPKGAQGLMQIMPQTAAELGVGNAYNPEANVNAGSEYLHRLLVQYHGDAQKALAAYNAGPLRVQQYGGVPPYRETRTYVARVINEYNQRRRTAAHEVPARRAGNSAHPKLSASAAR